jgi:hypothetical protein
MTTLGQMPKPDAGQFKDRRKLLLVPMSLFAPGIPEEGQRLLERYWGEVRDQIYNLEKSLGNVTHIYHETVFSEGDEGMQLLEALNPLGSSFIQVMCRSTAKLEATEDRALVEESSDWQRCISIGLISEKVLDIALEGYKEATRKRYEHISSRINDTLKAGETGVIFIREDHHVQFPPDVHVFYVAPPALDALRRWINDQFRAAAQPQSQQPGE